MKPELSKLLDELRNSPRGLEARALISGIEQRGLTIAEDDIREMLKRLSGSGFIPPNRVVEFVVRLVSERKITTTLDFGHGVVGFVSKALDQSRAEKIIALTQNREYAAISELLCKDTNIKVECADPIAWLEKSDERFDFAFGLPPWGFKSAVPLPLQGGSPTRNIDAAMAHIAWAGSRLTDDGIGVFVVPASFAENQSNRSVETLAQCGLGLVAYLSLPSGVFLPYTSAAGAVAVVARKSTSRIFVGALSDDSNRNDVLFSNLVSSREGRDVGTGRLVEPGDFRGVRSLEAEERVDRMAARLGLPAIRLQDVLVSVNLTKSSEPPGFEEQPNAVYLPLIGRGDAVTSTGQLRMKPHNYAQLLVNPAAAEAEYLAGFFNTPLGLAIREQASSGATIPKITKATIRLMTVFLPALETQRTTIETQNRLREYTAELRELEKRLWEQPRKCESVAKATDRFARKDSLPDWIDTLPFPLGSILWAYHTCGTDDKARYERLLHFFEAYGGFLATILLSVFWSDPELLGAEMKKIGEATSQHRFSLERADFGTWVRIFERLAKTSRQLLANAEKKEQAYDMFCARDDEVIENLCSSRVVSILQKANNRRNRWPGHGGIVSEVVAKERHIELQGYLTELRECLSVTWDRYELILPGQSTCSAGIHRYSVEKVRGRCAPFEKADAELNHTMDHGVLHFKAQDERRALPMLPLIKVMPSPRFAENACYFYSHQERDGVHFVSYHFDREADVTDAFPDTLQAIAKLNAAIGQANTSGD